MIDFISIVLEALKDTDPDQVQKVISKSFDDMVLSDLLAKASVRPELKWGDCKSCSFTKVCNAATEGNLIPTQTILDNLKTNIPKLFEENDIQFNINSSNQRVSITFNSDGGGDVINLPDMVNKEIGPIVILHEIAHKLYSIDILTSDILNHPQASNIFTLTRTMEDARVEKLIEQQYPESKQVFQARAKYIVPLYKQHTPSSFAKIVDDLFLNLRGYSTTFPHSKEYLKLGEQFISHGNNRQSKVNTVIELGELIMSEL